MNKDVFVVDGKRTPFGSFGGVLSDIPSTTSVQQPSKPCCRVHQFLRLLSTR